MDSGAQILTGTFRHDILTTLIFPDFNHAYIRRNKLDNLNINISTFISTEQTMIVMVLKILSEPTLSFIMIQ